MTSNSKQIPQTTQKHRVVAGNGKAAVTARRAAFVQAYLSNGHNATRAAITAGYSPRTAYSQGQRLLKKVENEGQLAAAARAAAEITGLTIEATLRETARISYSDPRRLFSEDGTLKNITEMDPDTSAAIASFEVEETTVDGAVAGRITKIKLCDKNRALDSAMKHLGLYERDNSQRAPNLALQIVLVGPD